MLTLLIDEGDAGMDYVEDCAVCCCPMVVSVTAQGDSVFSAGVRREDE